MDIIKRFVLNEKVKMIVNTTWDFNKCLKLFFIDRQTPSEKTLVHSDSRNSKKRIVQFENDYLIVMRLK